MREFRQSLVASFRAPCLGASRTQRCWMWSSPSLCAERAVSGCRLLPSAVMEVQPCLWHREEGRSEGGRRELLFPAWNQEEMGGQALSSLERQKLLRI